MDYTLALYLKEQFITNPQIKKILIKDIENYTGLDKELAIKLYVELCNYIYSL